MTTPPSRGDLGDEIRRKRKDLNLTQTDLAKLAAVATTNIGKIERGAPVSVTTMRAVARALELPRQMVEPYLAEDAGHTPGDISEDVVLARVARALFRQGLSAERVDKALDELREQDPALPRVEQRKASEQ